jgi:hypothetical protein
MGTDEQSGKGRLGRPRDRVSSAAWNAGRSDGVVRRSIVPAGVPETTIQRPSGLPGAAGCVPDTGIVVRQTPRRRCAGRLPRHGEER